MPVIPVAEIEARLAEVRALDWSKLSLEQATAIMREVEELDKFMASYGRVLCYHPHPKQLLFHDPPGRPLPRVRLLIGGNRLGKSHAGMLEAFGFCMGEHMWNGKKLPVRVPNRGRIVVTSYLDGGKKVIEPKLREIFPPELIKATKQGQQGGIIEVRLTNGSWFDIVSSEQESMKHEGADLDWVWCDEPLPRDHWIANWRGLTDRSGYAWLTLTPLSEPWIKQELYDKALFDTNYYVVQSSTRDNIGYGLTEKAVNEFAEALSEDEKSVRIEGNFMSLTGMVYKEYRDQLFPDGHLVEPFEIPEDWPRFCGIDPHDRTPTHIVWAAVSPEDDVYFYDELAIGGKTIKEIAEAIKEREEGQQTPPKRVLRIIDPASVRKTNVDTIGMNIGEEFTRNGIFCLPGNNDIIAGHKKVREFMRFEKTLRGERPRMFVFSSLKGQRRSIMNYIYDDRSIKGAAKDYREPKENRVREKDKHYPDCYDGKTEVLTTSGWQRFDSLERGVAVATLNIESNNLEYQVPTEYFEHEHSGDMVNIHSRSVDALVTPNHRMIVYPQSKTMSFRLAKDLKPQDRIPISSYGKSDEFCANRVIIGSKVVNSRDWAEFMGWYLAEGSATGTKGGKIQLPGRGYSVYVSQIPGDKCDILRSVLDRLPWKFAYGGKSFACSSKELWEYLRPLGNSKEKFIPRHILTDFSKDDLIALWNSYVLGDGWTQDNNKIASTISKRLSDDMVELLCLAGRAVSVGVRLPNDSVIRGRKIRTKYMQYHITEKISKVGAISDYNRNVCYKTVEYKGKVYCVSVPNQTLLVRRNGRVYFSGNCIRYLLMFNPRYIRRERDDESRGYVANNSKTGY